MSYYDQHQPPVSVPPQQGYPKDAYPPPGYPVQGYPQGYPPQGYPAQGYAPQYAAPPPRQETGFLEGCWWLRVCIGTKDYCIIDKRPTYLSSQGLLFGDGNIFIGSDATVIKDSNLIPNWDIL
ncbi:hypothetical protein D5086_025321 [Populus alba]|uniref:Uncharacterized protein n=1 Tax=Populus alba TaxID=43335 RepID=A0ACC4AZP4_POPAL